MARFSIFGLGYVGCVTAACLADAGHDVIGVDFNPLKVEMIQRGQSPIVEPGVAELISSAVSRGKLRATTGISEVISDTDISLICVGTPSNQNGSLDLSYVRRVCREIGEELARKSAYHIVTVRSTMLPGTIAGTVIPELEQASGKRAGKDFGVAINPEFLREGSSIRDFNFPPFTLIGADDESVARTLSAVYGHLDAPVISVGIKEAEMVKYACNSFHALKVTFANEIGIFCKALGVDSHKVMEVFCHDHKLNLSPYYLKPGFAFGGSCLPKDLRALNHRARELDLDLPMIGTVLNSNRYQIERAVELVLATRCRKVGVLGLSFKPNTDDLRESPIVTMVEMLIGKGFNLKIYDREVELARLFGANRNYIEQEIPHISSLMSTSIEEVIDESEVIIIAKRDELFGDHINRIHGGRTIIDLVRLVDRYEGEAEYQGICW